MMLHLSQIVLRRLTRLFRKSRANRNSAGSVSTNLVFLNVTDCSMRKLDSLVVCKPINLNILLLLSWSSSIWWKNKEGCFLYKNKQLNLLFIRLECPTSLSWYSLHVRSWVMQYIYGVKGWSISSTKMTGVYSKKLIDDCFHVVFLQIPFPQVYLFFTTAFL